MVIRILLVLLIFAFTVYTQSTVKEVWKEVSKDESYKLKMPLANKVLGKNSEVFVELLLGKKFDKSKIKNVSVVAKDEVYMFGYFDYPAPVLDEMERDARYSILTNIWSGKSVEPITYNELRGIAASETWGDYIDIKTRLFIVNQRVFILLAAVPKIKDLPESRKNHFLKRIEYFFNSFAPLTIPKAKYDPTPLPPKDFMLSLDGKILTSKTLGFSIKLPQKWNSLLDDPEYVMTEEQRIGYEKQDIGLRWLRRNRERIFLSYRDSTEDYDKKDYFDRTFFELNIERKEFASVSLDDFVKSRASFYEFGSNKDAENTIQKAVKINNRDFFILEKTTKQETTYLDLTKDLETQRTSVIYKKHYFSEWNGYILDFSIQYLNVSDGKIIDESIKTFEILDNNKM